MELRNCKVTLRNGIVCFIPNQQSTLSLREAKILLMIPILTPSTLQHRQQETKKRMKTYKRFIEHEMLCIIKRAKWKRFDEIRLLKTVFHPGRSPWKTHSLFYPNTWTENHDSEDTKTLPNLYLLLDRLRAINSTRNLLSVIFVQKKSTPNAPRKK